MERVIKTINPYDGQALRSYSVMTDAAITTLMKRTDRAFYHWKKTRLTHRISLVKEVRRRIGANREVFAKLMATEMGKPVSESLRELEKCLTICKYYEENAPRILMDRHIPTEAQTSFVRFDPIGCVLGIMPWNDPYAQVIRFAVPALLSGNVVLLKHAPNVTGCAKALQKIFDGAGFPANTFNILIAHPSQLTQVIENEIVKAVTFTGSTETGKLVAALAGKNLKKCVLELGGNNACIILSDADIDLSVKEIIESRMLSMGQNCIAAKRIIVVDEVCDTFLMALTEKLAELTIGDPLEETTQIGPLAREDLAQLVERQVKDSVSGGAQLRLGGERNGNIYPPTILTNVRPGMPAFDEEIFGPVASVIRVKNESEAFNLASNSKYGLGTMLFSRNTEKAKKRISDIEDGSFFVNAATHSDARLPFGGTKSSGTGHELSDEGMLEFVNKKTVYIR